MGNESDDASFTFGNADRVMRDLANDVDLYRATISFSLFHVGTGIKVDLWKGDIVNWSCDAGPEFKVTGVRWPVRVEPAVPDAQNLAHLLEGVRLAGVPVRRPRRDGSGSLPGRRRQLLRQELRHAERVPRARDEALLRRHHRRAAGRPDQGQLDRRVGLRAVHAHQRVAGRGFDLRPGARGGVHRHRDAGELQGRGGPGRERLLRGVGHRGRRPARGVHADSLRGQGRRRQRRDAGGPHARRAGAPRLPQERPRPPDGAWAPIRPARATSSRSTNPAT